MIDIQRAYLSYESAWRSSASVASSSLPFGAGTQHFLSDWPGLHAPPRMRGRRLLLAC
jgi:hypothetical protein